MTVSLPIQKYRQYFIAHTF